MNKERIIELIKEWFDLKDGQDYYDYLDTPHWFGDAITIDMFAQALMEEME